MPARSNECDLGRTVLLWEEDTATAAVVLECIAAEALFSATRSKRHRLGISWMDTAHKNARKRASLYAPVVQIEDERLNSLALELERPNASVGKQTSRSLRSLIDSAWRARRSELFAYKRCITVF